MTHHQRDIYLQVYVKHLICIKQALKEAPCYFHDRNTPSLYYMIIVTTSYISVAVTCCYQCKDKIMVAAFFLASFSTMMALGQMSVLTPVSGHPALNVFLLKIKGCMNHPVEQRDMRSVHLIIHYHYFMDSVFKPQGAY